MSETFIKEILQYKPELKIQVRGALEPGSSGAQILLVDFELNGERRLGVLKVTPSAKAEREAAGDSRARHTWLKPYLPDFFLSLKGGSACPVALLMSLARDRLENCETLQMALKGSLPYAKNYVLRTVAEAYRKEANSQWPSTEHRPVRENFTICIQDDLPHNWDVVWKANAFPPSEAASFVFENQSQRWPNPIAFLSRAELWPKDADFGISVPWIESHGDLNCRNILCPSVQRSLALSIATNEHQAMLKFAQKMQSYISLIDMPFCRVAPFTFDLSFLTTSLMFLLPPFDSRSQRDVVFKSFQAVFDLIRTEKQSISVPADGTKFVDCFEVILRSLVAAQPRMIEDTKKSLLSSLASTSLWQAIRIGSSNGLQLRARLDAIQCLCFSAMALDELLGVHVKRGFANEDFTLRAEPGGPSLAPWTPAASRLGDIFLSCRGRKDLIVVFGRQWNEYLHLPEVPAPHSLAQMEPSEILKLTNHAVDSKFIPSLQFIAKLPLATVFDWSIFPSPREIISKNLPAPRYLCPVVPGETEPAWSEHDAVFHIHLCGSLEVLPSVALSGPARNQARARLRGALTHFQGFRSGDFTVLYVGITPDDLKETHSYLQEFWGEKLRGCYVGPKGSEDFSSFLTEWNIEALEGTITDFLTACEDVPAPSLKPDLSPHRHILRIADMALSEDGSLMAQPGNILEVEVPTDDLQAMSRAGHVLLEADRSSLDNLTRDPKQFFVGHPIELAELHAGIAIEREPFRAYLNEVLAELGRRHLRTVSVVSRPGAGASTALRWLAYQLAFKHNVPLIILKCGGTAAFEAVERLYRLVGRSFVALADPQDIPSDQLAGLKSRCAPARYPVVFLSSLRALRNRPTDGLPLLQIELSQKEKEEFLKRLSRYCPSVPLQRLLSSPTKSLFLLTLEAFGEANIHVDPYVTELLNESTTNQALALAVIAFFSRYAHRGCSLEFLQILTDRGVRQIDEDLSSFDQLLVLKEGDHWVCRHDQLSKAILQYHLTRVFSDQYRYELARFVRKVIQLLGKSSVGKEIAADYIWAILNPQVEAEHGVGGERPQQSRLIGGEDGLPTLADRYQVFFEACQVFPTDTNILAHFGKYLSEEEKKYGESDSFLLKAHQLEPKNEAIAHMIGKRYSDELRGLLDANPPTVRPQSIDESIEALATEAHSWFGKARELDLSDQFGYTTAIQLNLRLIRDQFHRIGIRSAAEDPSSLKSDRIMKLLSDTYGLIADGQRYIEPIEGCRRVFNQARDQLHALRGDLSTAIRCFEGHVRTQRGVSQSFAKVQLARLLHERAEINIVRGEHGKANKDFNEAERQLYEVMQDPALKYKNIRLWFDCARHLTHWRRPDFLARLHQLHEHDPSSLDAVFLLMCLYFCEALDTLSSEAWRNYVEFQSKSAVRSASLAIRRYIREWLVKVSILVAGKEIGEYRIFPHYYFEPGEMREHAGFKQLDEPRVRVLGVVLRIESSTEGYLEIQPMRFQVYFRPRAGDKVFYKSDAEKRTPVSFLIAFNYEKPEAYDVERIT